MWLSFLKFLNISFSVLGIVSNFLCVCLCVCSAKFLKLCSTKLLRLDLQLFV